MNKALETISEDILRWHRGNMTDPGILNWSEAKENLKSFCLSFGMDVQGMENELFNPILNTCKEQLLKLGLIEECSIENHTSLTEKGYWWGYDNFTGAKFKALTAKAVKENYSKDQFIKETSSINPQLGYRISEYLSITAKDFKDIRNAFLGALALYLCTQEKKAQLFTNQTRKFTTPMLW